MIRILPNDKSDLEACANLALASDELIEPHIKELFVWLEDMNWPVAKKISDRLSSLGMELVPELRHILNSDNNLWKFGIVSDFLYGVNDEVYDALFFNLKHIQKHPTVGERKAQVNLKADLLINSRKPLPHVIHESDVNSGAVDNSQNSVSSKNITDPASNQTYSVSHLNIAENSPKTFIIDGNNFNTLEEFYSEIDGQFSLESHRIKNLDGFNEALQLCLEKYPAGFTLRWENSSASKKRLGYAETIRQLQKRLEGCHPNQKKIVTDAVDRAKLEGGATVFDWLVTIIEYQNVSASLGINGKILVNLG